MRTWQSTDRWSPYVAVPELEAWRESAGHAFAMAHVDNPDTKAVFEVIRNVHDGDVHAEGVRAFRSIIAGQRSKLNARTDRLLAKRTDALGQLFARAPKATRKAA